MRGTRMPQRVRMEVGAARTDETIAPDEKLNRARIEPATTRRDEERVRIDEARPWMSEHSANLEPRIERRRRLPSERDEPFLAPLAQHACRALAVAERELPDVEPTRFRDA